MNPSIKQKKEQQYFFDEIEKGRKDMQGLIARGYDSLNASLYLFLEITNPVQAKKYFSELIEKYITRADKTNDKSFPEKGDPANAVHIAFTSSGLKETGLSQDILDTFSREFIEGMSYTYPDKHNKNIIEERSTLLGDTNDNRSSRWHWGNTETKPVHCVLMLYAKDSNALTVLERNVFININEGVRVVHTGNTFEYNPNDEDKEHFGFRDGLSQPNMKGFSQSKGKADNQLINPGEFILGYKNEYEHYSPSPYVESDAKSVSLPDMPPDMPRNKNKKDLGKNGTYLVFRQIEQHVERFWKFLYLHSKESPVTQTEKAIKFGAKMVGRWPEGQPLTICPEGAFTMDDDSLNEFAYADLDKDGIRCPLGAHIRRTNPRDQVHTGRDQEASIEMTSRHRMLRRGRIYGDPVDKKMNIENIINQVKDKELESNNNVEKTPVVRGLHFICLVSDIGRQFEFIQNVWANTSTFGDLCNEVDPMISPRPTKYQPQCHEFTTPQETVRNRYKEVPEFTTVVGGAYFFMPGITALKYIMKE